MLHFGVSNFSARQLELLQSGLKQKLRANQMQFGIMCAGMVSHSLEANTHFPNAADRDGEVLDYCRLKGITIQAWSPFQYGFFEGVFIDNEKFPALNEKLQQLSEKYGVSKSALAVAWILRHPAGIQAIVGTTKAQRLADIATAADTSCRNQKNRAAAAKAVCPAFFYALSRGFATKAAKVPKKMAAAVPAAPAERPPVNTPKKPSSATALRTPSDRAQPKPVRGTVAPQPANSARGPRTAPGRPGPPPP